MCQQLKKLPQQVVVGLCLCFTQPSWVIQWLLPFSSAACGARQIADLLQQSKFYVVLKEGKNLWYQSAHSYVHVFFLLWSATLSDHCQREYRGPAQLVPCEDAGLHCAHSERAKRTACSLNHP